MKKIILALALVMGFSGIAQQNRHHSKKQVLKELSAEQVATLHTKKMTLALDLDESQQQQLFDINVAEAEYRKSKMAAREKRDGKSSADELFELQNERLDRQIAHQQQLKEILTDEQFQVWKKLNLHRKMKTKRSMKRQGRSR